MRNIDLMQVLQAKPRVAGSRIGTIVSLQRRPVVDFSGNPLAPQQARVVASLSAETLAMAHGAHLPVLLVFEDDDPSRPVIVDVVIDELSRLPTRGALYSPPAEQPRTDRHTAAAAAATAINLTTIVGIDPDGVLVRGEAPGGKPVRARTAVALRNLKDPVLILGLPDGTAVIVGQVYDTVPLETRASADAEVSLRGSRVRIEADLELILKAGGCEIRMDALGKMVTTADTLVSRARGANKVQGGTVQLN
jgi:hypothetical protein